MSARDGLLLTPDTGLYQFAILVSMAASVAVIVAAFVSIHDLKARMRVIGRRGDRWRSVGWTVVMLALGFGEGLCFFSMVFGSYGVPCIGELAARAGLIGVSGWLTVLRPFSPRCVSLDGCNTVFVAADLSRKAEAPGGGSKAHRAYTT